MDDLEQRFLDRDEQSYWEEEMEKAAAARAPITSFRGEFFFLSNFYLRPLTYRGHTYKTAEHAFQAQKATTEQDRRKVADCRTPGEAKRAGKAIACRKDWKKIRVRVMAEVQREKYRDRELRRWLLATEERDLVEGNDWHDYFWGVCGGRGENWLGELLMAERERIEEEEKR